MLFMTQIKCEKVIDFHGKLLKALPTTSFSAAAAAINVSAR